MLTILQVVVLVSGKYWLTSTIPKHLSDHESLALHKKFST